MTQRILALIVFIFLLVACEGKETCDQVNDPICFVKLRDSKLQTLLLRYYKEYEEELQEYGVLTIRFIKVGEEFVYYVSYILLQSELAESPSYYSKVSNHFVLIYTGIEDKLEFEESTINRFKEHISPNLINDIRKPSNNLVTPPITYDPPIWEATFLKEADQWDYRMVDRLPY